MPYDSTDYDRSRCKFSSGNFYFETSYHEATQKRVECLAAIEELLSNYVCFSKMANRFRLLQHSFWTVRITVARTSKLWLQVAFSRKSRKWNAAVAAGRNHLHCATTRPHRTDRTLLAICYYPSGSKKCSVNLESFMIQGHSRYKILNGHKTFSFSNYLFQEYVCCCVFAPTVCVSITIFGLLQRWNTCAMSFHTSEVYELKLSPESMEEKATVAVEGRRMLESDWASCS